eukprot:gnl/MRDRNA2_/MRDRNA2_32618_c0_seq1.p1 gnl/MRDRNA2_/MRDRNA2_32618_c0~~gnl/MRDRNA2_/MRDRNA2_32618_c0_seq1.p1  ORF type:complete len:224 (-),score=62.44 gnl/MRDRNA2_/MRDRNA2_32618_c0_seq1:47-718(-)
MQQMPQMQQMQRPQTQQTEQVAPQSPNPPMNPGTLNSVRPSFMQKCKYYPGCQKGNACPMYHDRSKGLTQGANAAKAMSMALATRQAAEMRSPPSIVKPSANGQFIDFETGQPMGEPNAADFSPVPPVDVSKSEVVVHPGMQRADPAPAPIPPGMLHPNPAASKKFSADADECGESQVQKKGKEESKKQGGESQVYKKGKEETDKQGSGEVDPEAALAELLSM